MNIGFKKLHEKSVMPKFANVGDFGADLTTVDEGLVYTEDGVQYIEYRTGLAVQLPENVAGMVLPRSSVSKKHLILCNSIGLIDQGYTGEILVRFKIVGNGELKPNIYRAGDRIAQMVFVPVITPNLVEVQELQKTARGTGGFGSTGK